MLLQRQQCAVEGDGEGAGLGRPGWWGRVAMGGRQWRGMAAGETSARMWGKADRRQRLAAKNMRPHEGLGQLEWLSTQQPVGGGGEGAMILPPPGVRV